MWLTRSYIIPYLLLAIANAAYIDMAKIDKRAVAYVTIVTTVNNPATTDIATSEVIEQAPYTSTTPIANVQTTSAAVAAAPDVVTANTVNTVATTQNTGVSSSSSSNSSGGIGSWLSSLFGLDNDSSSSSSLTTTAAANTVATQQATTSSTDSSTSGSGGIASWLAGLFGLGGSSSSSSTGLSTTSSTYSYSVGSPVATSTGSSQPVYSSSTSLSSGGLTSSSGGLTSSGGLSSPDNGSGAAVYAEKSKGITYSPYTKSDACKTASEVASDMELLKDYPLIRLYSVDCSGIENVLLAISSSQKLFLGVWEIDASSLSSELETMKQAVESSSRGWSAVHTISIGNEQVNSGLATVAQVATAVQSARSWLKTNAPLYSGYVVTVDTYNQVIANPSMCDISDYIAVNCHPFFTGSVEPSGTGPWLVDQINSVSNACGGSKPVLITETGWPTQGDSIGSCVPSESNQLAAFKSLIGSAADQIISFTMYNDYWKSPGPYNVEQHWGIYGDPSV